MALESIHVSGPEAAERRQPGVDLPKRFRLQAVEAALRIHRGFHEAGLAQHAQVLGDGWLGHAKPALDLSDRLLGSSQKAQDRAAAWLRNDLEHRLHALSILQREYTCKGI